MTEQKRKVDTIRLQNLSYGHKQAATLMAAVELDLFTFVSRGTDRLPALAAAMGLNRLNAERLVTSCTALALLEKYGDQYLNAVDVERFLVKDK